MSVDLAAVPTTISDPVNARILQVSECRGHDFPVVLLVGIERLADGAAERTLFYRAATRAQHLLLAYGVAEVGLSDEVAECALRCADRD